MKRKMRDVRSRHRDTSFPAKSHIGEASPLPGPSHPMQPQPASLTITSIRSASAHNPTPKISRRSSVAQAGRGDTSLPAFLAPRRKIARCVPTSLPTSIARPRPQHRHVQRRAHVAPETHLPLRHRRRPRALAPTLPPHIPRPPSSVSPALACTAARRAHRRHHSTGFSHAPAPSSPSQKNKTRYRDLAEGKDKCKRNPAAASAGEIVSAPR
ncbi:hypothetical protein K438DRAFT_1189717 [Mycena galopus ATCC 62051]|nr:hypothetical protein K438DRAFT_1189717 [Mycena galopus ATCC 62051]